MYYRGSGSDWDRGRSVGYGHDPNLNSAVFLGKYIQCRINVISETDGGVYSKRYWIRVFAGVTKILALDFFSDIA